MGRISVFHFGGMLVMLLLLNVFLVFVLCHASLWFFFFFHSFRRCPRRLSITLMLHLYQQT